MEKRLVVRGEEPFAITQVVCADDRFEFDVPAGTKKLHFVKMRFSADASSQQDGPGNPHSKPICRATEPLLAS